MFKILFILTTIIGSSIGKSSTPDDFCILTSSQQACRGHYDIFNNYQVKCEPTCMGKYSHKCGILSMCSINKNKCEFYLKIKKFQQVSWLNFGIDKSLLQSFDEKIKICQTNQNKYISSEVCSIRNECQIKKFSTSRYNGKHLKKSKCPCSNEHTFECDTNVCTTYKHSCLNYKLRNKNNTISILNCTFKNK
jgi:hypothetical protein